MGQIAPPFTRAVGTTTIAHRGRVAFGSTSHTGRLPHLPQRPTSRKDVAEETEPRLTQSTPIPSRPRSMSHDQCSNGQISAGRHVMAPGSNGGGSKVHEEEQVPQSSRQCEGHGMYLGDPGFSQSTPLTRSSRHRPRDSRDGASSHTQEERDPHPLRHLPGVAALSAALSAAPGVSACAAHAAPLKEELTTQPHRLGNLGNPGIRGSVYSKHPRQLPPVPRFDGVPLAQPQVSRRSETCLYVCL